MDQVGLLSFTKTVCPISLSPEILPSMMGWKLYQPMGRAVWVSKAQLIPSSQPYSWGLKV